MPSATAGPAVPVRRARRHHRDRRRRARPGSRGRACAARRDGFRARSCWRRSPARRGGLLVGPAHFSAAEVVGAIARRLTGGAAGRLAGHGRRRRAPAPRAGRLPRGGGARGRRARRCRGCFATRSPSPACSGSRPGASLGAVLAISSTIAGRAVSALPLAAFLGAAADALLVFAIAARRGRGRLFSGTLLLVGVAVARSTSR